MTSRPKKNPAPKSTHPVPIVGIGASAGGLEALEAFLGGVPEKSGLAFVVIQHLDPTCKGLMPEILQRATDMEVFQGKDDLEVKANSVYVIPPNRDMSILHGKLQLFEPSEPRGLRLPIDFFLSSLAEDQQQYAVGVILSGMGSDGTIGVRAIKEKGGLVLAQEPASAKFDSMPRSVIDAELADLIAPAGEIPGKILEFLSHARVLAKAPRPLGEEEQNSKAKVLILLRSKTGHDFSMYKKNTLDRRIERRMSIHKLVKISAYVRYLQENPQELELLFKELLIGVTNFFRDREGWDKLRDEILTALFESNRDGGVLRAWSVGCSTGEEAYSLAIVFKEALEEIKPEMNFTLQIFATDLDKDGIDKARQGVYPASIAADVSPARLRRFFVKEGGSYRVGKEIREMVTFATQNIVKDPPFTKLDLLICRNLLIYLNAEVQKRLLPLFHYSLNPGGVLFLGSSESVTASADLFVPLDSKLRLFGRRETVLVEQVVFPASFAPALSGDPTTLAKAKPLPNLQSLADQLLLQDYSPPAVLVNNRGDILYINGRTGKYLEPAAGKANWNIYAMAREGLRFDLGIAFQKAFRQKGPVAIKGLNVEKSKESQRVDITIQAIEEPKALRGMAMIVFSDVPTPPKKRTAKGSKTSPVDKTQSLEMEQDLLRVRQELKMTHEEMQSSQEELKSVNEELQSANEELQSTNEELTTSREEMQSLNEELQTVNAEQQSKMEELSRVNNDMKNLLNSTEIVTVFLDKKLMIRRFTSGADNLFKLLPGDVGRPLSDIVSDLRYPDLAEDAEEVLRTLIFSEKQIETNDGRWFSVRIMPYRTMEDVISGVVTTFTNITAAKKLETTLRKEIAELQSQLEPDS